MLTTETILRDTFRFLHKQNTIHCLIEGHMGDHLGDWPGVWPIVWALTLVRACRAVRPTRQTAAGWRGRTWRRRRAVTSRCGAPPWRWPPRRRTRRAGSAPSPASASYAAGRRCGHGLRRCRRRSSGWTNRTRRQADAPTAARRERSAAWTCSAQSGRWRRLSSRRRCCPSPARRPSSTLRTVSGWLCLRNENCSVAPDNNIMYVYTRHELSIKNFY